MIRAKEFEDAVKQTLGLYKLKYMRVENYRCFKCGQVQNSKAKGWPDFFVYFPVVLAIECKTGAGGLSKAQRVVLDNMEQSGIAVLVLHDNVDDLLKYLKENRPPNP